MANGQPTENWDDLGKSIEELIDRAVNSQNFQKLSQDIGRTINNAVEKAAAKPSPPQHINQNHVRRTQQPSHQAFPGYKAYPGNQETPWVQQAPIFPILYQNPSRKNTAGVFQTVGGSIMTFIFGISLLDYFTFPSLVFFGIGLGLLYRGTQNIGRVKRFRRYLGALGQKTYASIDSLARSIQRSPKFVTQDIKAMIREGYFLEGHLDKNDKTLITSDDTFHHYEETLLEQQRQKREKRMNQKEKKAETQSPKPSAEVQKVLDQGHSYLAEIKACNAEIPGEVITAKISRMELLVDRIFQRAEQHPETVDDLKKLLDYYLPMTVKLLQAYAEMDKHPLESDTVNNSKQEIEQTIDTLNTAFEKLLDSLFQASALDVSSDISVLNTLLAQEGLTDDSISQATKKKDFL